MRRRFGWLVLFVLLLAPACAPKVTQAQREASFRPFAQARVREDLLSDFLARRTVHLLSIRHVELARDRAGNYQVKRVVPHAAGTGVVLTRDGYVLTAAHVAREGRLVALVPQADGELGVAVPRAVWVSTSETLPGDLALLKVDASLPAAFDWSPPSTVVPGTPVVSAGHSTAGGRLHLSYAGGRVLDPPIDPMPAGAPVAVVRHSAPLVHGDSGGPLVTPTGQLLALNVARRHFPLKPSLSSALAVRPEATWINRMIAVDRVKQRQTGVP